mgnify:CR=1 FL=1
MRTALACLLGCAGGAPGRDVPVYREYTVPISFATESEEQTVADAAAPDLAALQTFRDVQTREALMGKEALLQLGLVGGSSAFNGSAPVPGKLSPPAVGADGRRGKKNNSGDNWLVKSLSLPALGQTTSNAATSVMTAEQNGSGWGWLVDEVANASDGGAAKQEEWRPETAESNPFLRDRTDLSSQADRADALPADALAGENSAAAWHAPARADFPGRETAGSDPSADFAAPISYRTSADVAGGMSQTRELIAEFSENARPDFASLRESLVSVSAGGAKNEDPLPADRMGLDRSSSFQGLLSAGGGSGFSSSAASMRSGTEPSWRGEWSASRVESSVLPAPASPLQAPKSRPVPASVGSTRPNLSSGGYKPAWY